MSENSTEIIGYADPWIVSPGDTVEVKVSSTEANYSHRLVRLIQGHTGPHAPPVQEEEIPEAHFGDHTNGVFKCAHPGSYARVDDWADIHFSVSENEGLEVEFYAQPYLLDTNKIQTLISTLNVTTRSGFAVVLGTDSRLQFLLGTGVKIQVVQSSFVIRRWRWLKINFKLIWNKFTATVQQIDRLVEKSPVPEFIEHILSEPGSLNSGLSLFFATGLFESPVTASLIPTCFFNGRLDSPSFKTLGSSATVIAKYDFSAAVSSDTIVDKSGFAHHGILVNAPTRAVKGHDWDGSEPDWTKATYGYGAIHFHEDDLDDANWATDFSVIIPSAARSGAYAVEVKTKDGKRDMITFFVRPNQASKVRVAMILSTFTYLAYANERMYDESKPTHMEVPGGAKILEDDNYKLMVKRSDLGLSMYDAHSDGSGCIFSSSKRPMLNVRPGYVHWGFQRPREFSADLLMIGFLERLGIPYDIVTDHDLHIGGYKVIKDFDVVITGCHPEYPSLESFNAYSAFVKNGGNIMYLGGNGFYWTSVTDPLRPWRMEVRRGDQGCRTFGLPAGERIHSLNGHQGGLWRSRGRAPNYLFGIGSAACGTGPGVPYAATEEGMSGAYKWVFNGTNAEKGELIGVHGFGGGASGDEIDRLDFDLGSPYNTVLLATSTGHSDLFGVFNEEIMFPMVNTLGTTCDKVRSDMTFYETSAGGGVFSVGSINWYSSLAWDSYENNVAKITDNVLREFVRRGKGGFMAS